MTNPALAVRSISVNAHVSEWPSFQPSRLKNPTSSLISWSRLNQTPYL
jgi:hypothetical protein